MNFSMTYFLLKGYLLDITKRNHNSLIFKITLLTIITTVFVLHLSYSIMQGFTQNVTQYMEKVHPSLLVQTSGITEEKYEEIKNQISKEYPLVKISYYPCHYKQTLIQNCLDPIIMPTVCIGIDPEYVFILTTNKEEQLLIKEKLLHNNCIIGQKLGNKVGLEENDNCIFFTQKKGTFFKKIDYEKIKNKIGHVLRPANSFYHQNTIYCSRSTFKNLFKTNTIDALHIILNNENKKMEIKSFIEKKFNYSVDTWQTLNPEINDIIVLQNTIFLILLGLLLFTNFSITVGLISAEINKRKIEIAGLLMLGLDTQTIKFTFLLLTIIITSFSTVVGILTSYQIGLLINSYELITIPAGSFITKIDCLFNLKIILIFIIINLILGLLTTYFSTRSIDTINISDSLRHEN